MGRKVVLVVGALSLAGVLVRGASGCSSSESNQGSADAESDARRDAAVFDAGVGVLDSSDQNSPLKGWTFLNYDPSCPFFIPASSASLPPPIQWEPCSDAGIQPSGLTCKQMSLNWSPPTGSLATTMVPPAWVNAGSVTATVTRATSQGTYFVTADVDGAVSTAIYETDTATCVLIPEGVSDGKYAFHVDDSRVQGKVSDFGGGMIGGDTSSLTPTIALQFKDTADHSQAPGLPGLLDYGTGNLTLYPWASAGSPQNIWSSAQEHLALNFVFFQGPTLFFEADQGTINKEKISTSEGGVQDFIGFGNDSTQGAADLGTDGTNMVWMYGSGTADAAAAGLYTTNSIMTAPYTTNPAAVSGRRLRSEVANGFGVSPFVVGCGYAVRSTYQGDRIVRLTDGVSWLLTESSTWNWQSPVAITCDEVFLNVFSTSPPQLNLVRVRLDSLGAGTPPD